MSTRPGLASPLALVQESAIPRISGAAASTVVRVVLGPSEWALVVQPPGMRVPLPSPPAFAGPIVSSLPRLALVRIPGPADPRLGLAMLLYSRGRTQICCLENHITDRAAGALSALADHALQMVLGGDANGGTADPEPRITVTRVEHSLRPTDHSHVASAEVRGCDVTFEVCSHLVSAELADALGLLCTAFARTLAGYGSARIAQPGVG